MSEDKKPSVHTIITSGFLTTYISGIRDRHIVKSRSPNARVVARPIFGLKGLTKFFPFRVKRFYSKTALIRRTPALTASSF